MRKQITRKDICKSIEILMDGSNKQDGVDEDSPLYAEVLALYAFDELNDPNNWTKSYSSIEEALEL